MSDRSDGEIMLFGVRVKVDPMRKSASMNNLSDYAPLDNSSLPVAAPEGGGGYASADDAVPLPAAASVSRERKRGVPWTEEEHKLFLLGLQKVGKGDWRGISKKYVKTRNPTQVASHAQKYFLRRNNFNGRRRRSSLFDITTDSVSGVPMEEGKSHQEDIPPKPVQQPTTVALPVTSNSNRFPVAPFPMNPMNVGPVLLSMQGGNPMENSALDQSDRAINNPSAMLVCPVPVFPMATNVTMSSLNLYQQPPHDQSPLSLSLSLSSGHDNSSTRDSAAFQVTSSFKHGDSFISVA